MSALQRLVALHGLCLALCTPLFAAYLLTPDTRATGDILWILAGASSVYIGLAVFGLPTSLNKIFDRWGLSPSLVKLALLAVASINVSVPLLDLSSAGWPIFGLVFLGGAALLFVMAVRRALQATT